MGRRYDGAISTTFLLTVALLVAATSAAAEPAFRIDTYPLPGGGEPTVLSTRTGDGEALWLTMEEPARLVRMTLPKGSQESPAFSNIPTPATLGDPRMLASDPHGNLWITGTTGIGRLGKDGELAVFPHAHGMVSGVTSGPDGRIWFVFTKENRHAFSSLQHFVGRLSPDLEKLDVIPIEAENIEPVFLINGPDGNVWSGSGLFSKAALLRIDPAGTVTLYPLSSGSPIGVAAGPDGNVWFADGARDRIGRISPANGEITEFAVAEGSRLNTIAAGPDGAMWFTGGKTNQVGRITLDGKQIETAAVPGGGELTWITAGPDGNMWFTMTEPGRVGRVRLPTPESR